MFQRPYSEPCQIKTTKQTVCHTDRQSPVYAGRGRLKAALSALVFLCVRKKNTLQLVSFFHTRLQCIKQIHPLFLGALKA